MRLTCPNCRAQYDVPDTAIPDEGRDVECSNCGHGWFQAPEEPQGDGALVLDQDMTVPVAPPPPRPRKLDPAVEDILRSEADREVKARAAETPAAQIETQTELGLQAPPPRRRDGAAELFPDVDEINSTLRSASEQRGLKPKSKPAAPAPEPLPVPEAAPEASRFGAGVQWGLGLVLGLVLLYLAGPKIAAEIPELAIPVLFYVDAVDALRLVIDGVFSGNGV